MPTDVFLVCSHLNAHFAEQLEKALQGEQIGVTLSLDNASGDDQGALADARLMIVVASQPSLNSPRVRAQVESALAAGLPVIVAQIGNLKERPDALDAAVWVDEWEDQSQANLNAIVAATKTQLSALKAATQTENIAATSGRDDVDAVGETREKHDVFLSYSRVDEAFADEIYDALRAIGVDAWLDRRNIAGGADWEAEIRKGLNDSHMLLLLISPDSIGSRNVRLEIGRATRLGLPILPVKFRALKPKTDWPMVLDEVNWLDVSDNPRKSLEKIADATSAQLARIPARLQLPPTENAQSEDEGAVRKVVNKVVGAARVPRVPKWPLARSEGADEMLSIESALKFRGVRQSRLFGAIRAGAADVESTDKRGRTALHYAASEGEIEIIVLLLEGAADINAADGKGATPLHLAVENLDATRLLLMNGADVAAKNGEGKTPVDRALAEKMATEDLLVLWSDIKRGRKTANQALQQSLVAEASVRARAVADALAAGADDLVLADSKGRTALHWAAREAELELVEFLLEAGADAKQRDEEGKLRGRKGASAQRDRSEKPSAVSSARLLEIGSSPLENRSLLV